MPESEIISFYRGTGRDRLGRSLSDIRAFTLDELEETHDFIQWLFPLPEPSSSNPKAPRLTPDDIRVFAAEPRLQTELLESFRLMLRFYGFALGGTREAPAIKRASDYVARRDVWLSPANHNYLRITRVLRSLRLLGFQAHKHAFLQCLESIYREQPDAIGAPGIRFWREA